MIVPTNRPFRGDKLGPWSPTLLRLTHQSLFSTPRPVLVNNTFIYAARKHGTAGRVVTNEIAVVNFLKAYVQELQPPGTLEVYPSLDRHREIPSFEDVIQKFSRAKVIIGVFGGAMLNTLWSRMGKNTTVIEIVTEDVNYSTQPIFNIAYGLDFNYWNLVIRNTTPFYLTQKEYLTTNISIPLEELRNILKAAIH